MFINVIVTIRGVFVSSAHVFHSVLRFFFFFPTLSLLENYVQQACISITKVVSECHLGALLQLTGTNINLLSVATTRLTCELLSGRRVAPFDSNNKIIFLNLQIVHYRCTSEHCMLE